MEWRNTSLSDLELLQKTAENNSLFANNYSAANCVLYQKKFQSQIIEKDGWLFERYMDCPCLEKKVDYEGNAVQPPRAICYSFPHKIEGNGTKEEIRRAIEFIVEEEGNRIHDGCSSRKFSLPPNNSSSEAESLPLKDCSSGGAINPLKNCSSETGNLPLINGSSVEASLPLSNSSFSHQTFPHPLIFSNVTLKEKDLLLELYHDAKVIPTPESGDYIYRTEKLSGLAGKKLSRKRNHISQFKKKYPDYSFEILNENNLFYAYEIEEAWLAENEKAGPNPELQAEKELIFSALDNFSTFSKTCSMTGGILFAHGEAAAFCIASRLSKSVTDVHFEKCLSTFAQDGGYPVITNEFSKTVKTDLINREEDLGIEGLRKAKLSWYPETVVEKFRVVIGG